MNFFAVKTFFLALSLILFSGHLSLAIGKTKTSVPKDACFQEDEIFADLLDSFIHTMGAKAIECDALLSTDDYFNLSTSVIMVHKNQVQEFSKPLQAFCKRNGMDPLQYIRPVAKVRGFPVNL
jgi:hypothetical protein